METPREEFERLSREAQAEELAYANKVFDVLEGKSDASVLATPRITLGPPPQMADIVVYSTPAPAPSALRYVLAFVAFIALVKIAR